MLYLLGGRSPENPFMFQKFQFHGIFFYFILKEKRGVGGDFGCKFFSMQIFADESYIVTFVRSLRLVT